MERDKLEKILEEIEVLQTGHFLLTSGKHSNKYMQCAKIFQYPKYSEKVSKALAEKFKDHDIDIVIGPAIGGIILAYEVARQIGVKALFAERENGVMKLRRGFEIPQGSKVLVVEDVITTGGSVKEVIELVESMNASIVGVGSVVDRSGGKVTFGYQFESVIKLDFETYEAENCPMCAQGSSPYKPGSRNI